MKNRPGYMVVELNHSGIPDEDLVPEMLSPFQEQVLAKLDAHIREKVRRGCPIAVVDLESSERIAEFNIGNIKPSQIDLEILARNLLPKIKDFYADPENRRKYEEWKRAEEMKKKKYPDKE